MSLAIISDSLTSIIRPCLGPASRGDPAEERGAQQNARGHLADHRRLSQADAHTARGSRDDEDGDKLRQQLAEGIGEPVGHAARGR